MSRRRLVRDPMDFELQTTPQHAVTSSRKPPVPAVEQAAKVLVLLARSHAPRLTLTEICRAGGIHKSKGYNILQALSRFGMVEKDARSKTYALGPGLVYLARRFLDRLDMGEVVAPWLRTLAAETRMTAFFGMISAEQVFVVAKEEGGEGRIGVTLRLGHRFHMTAGAHGKAIVAFLPQEEREAVLSRKRLFFFGEDARVDLVRLHRELALCRRRGYAEDAGEFHPGIYAVSAPVAGHLDRIIGCLVLVGAAAPEPGFEPGPKVAAAAREVSRRLGADLEKVFAFSREKEALYGRDCTGPYPERDGELRV